MDTGCGQPCAKLLPTLPRRTGFPLRGVAVGFRKGPLGCFAKSKQEGRWGRKGPLGLLLGPRGGPGKGRAWGMGGLGQWMVNGQTSHLRPPPTPAPAGSQLRPGSCRKPAERSWGRARLVSWAPPPVVTMVTVDAPPLPREVLGIPEGGWSDLRWPLPPGSG